MHRLLSASNRTNAMLGPKECCVQCTARPCFKVFQNYFGGKVFDVGIFITQFIGLALLCLCTLFTFTLLPAQLSFSFTAIVDAIRFLT